MSRIGRRPVPLPQGVTAQVDGRRITVKGPKGEISRTINPELAMAVEGETVVVRRPSDEHRHKALHGLTRTLVANMVEGVTKGFQKTLEIQGVGYKAEPKPFGVQLVVGFSHPVPYHAPQGIKISVENNVLVKVEGVDKEPAIGGTCGCARRSAARRRGRGWSCSAPRSTSTRSWWTTGAA